MMVSNNSVFLCVFSLVLCVTNYFTELHEVVTEIHGEKN